MTDRIKRSPYRDSVSGEELASRLNITGMSGDSLKDLSDKRLKLMGVTREQILVINTAFFALRENKMSQLRSVLAEKPVKYDDRYPEDSNQIAPENPFSHGRHGIQPFELYDHRNSKTSSS